MTTTSQVEQALQRENARLLNTIRVQAAAIEVMQADAARYRWLRSASGVDLRSDGSTWSSSYEAFVAPFSLAANGVRFGAYASLDELIDNAMKKTK